MKVVTPATRLDVRINKVKVEDELLVLDGVAGPLPCKTSLSPTELRSLLRLAMRPAVLALLFRK